MDAKTERLLKSALEKLEEEYELSESPLVAQAVQDLYEVRARLTGASEDDQ